MIDRRGAKRVMSLGCVLGAAGLALAAAAPHWTVYLLAWCVLGLAMRMTLYDAAFAALVQVAPARGRRAISYLTLFGGFASTVFWPIGHVLEAAFGVAGRAVGLRRGEPWGGAALTRGRCARPSARRPRLRTILRPRRRSRRLSKAGARVRHRSVRARRLDRGVHLRRHVGASAGGPAGARARRGDRRGARRAQRRGAGGRSARRNRVRRRFHGDRRRPILDRPDAGLLPRPDACGRLVLGALAFIALFGVANGLITIVRGSVPLACSAPGASAR